MDVQIILTLSILLPAVGILLIVYRFCLLQEKNDSPHTRFELRPLDAISTGLNKDMIDSRILPPPSYDEVMKSNTDYNKAPPSYLEAIEIPYQITIA